MLLIGYRGAGKTVVARRLADRLGWRAIDADDEVERRAGSTIARLFASQGEQAFRDLEQRVVEELCDIQRAVVSLGGGAVLREANRRCIRRAGPVVWLNAPAETLAERIATDESTDQRRPSLTGLDPAEEVRRLLEERQPLYRECATLVVDVAARDPDRIAEEIDSRLFASPDP